jgi:hypothetical protein
MSENMTDTFHRKEMFESNEMSNKGEEASELFELINQLNDDEDNNNNSDSNDDNQSSNDENSIESNSNQDSNLNEEEGKVNINRDELNINVNTNERLINHKNSNNNQTPIESLIKPIETISISTNGKTSSIQTFQNRSEKMNLMLLKKSVQKSTNGEGGVVNEEIARSEPKPQQQQKLATKIPRIPSLHKKENILNSSVSENTTKAPLKIQSQNVQDTSSSSATTSPTNSLSYKLTHELNKLTQENSRNPRSISKPPGKFKYSFF